MELCLYQSINYNFREGGVAVPRARGRAGRAGQHHRPHQQENLSGKPDESARCFTPPEPERFVGKKRSPVPNSPSPIPNTKQKASLSFSQGRPDGLYLVKNIFSFVFLHRHFEPTVGAGSGTPPANF
jgi:hypothetical protein